MSLGPSTKDVRQNLELLNHPSASPCPGASEFPKPPPLPGRPRPDFPTIIFTQLLTLAEKSKSWVNRRIRRSTPVDILVKYKGLIVLLPVQIID